MPVNRVDRIRRCLPILLCVLPLAPSTGGDDWVRVRSAHFEVLSDASPERARGLTQALTFTCGAQGEPVTARYRPMPAPGPDGADGTLMSLTFESR